MEPRRLRLRPNGYGLSAMQKLRVELLTPSTRLAMRWSTVALSATTLGGWGYCGDSPRRSTQYGWGMLPVINHTWSHS